LKSLLVFRPLNLLIVAVLQLVTYHFIDFNHPPINKTIVLLIAASLCVTAGGYLFNDWMDQSADLINKPEKQYVSSWSKGSFWIAYVCLTALGLGLSFIVSIDLFYYYLLVVLILVFYSLWLKRLPLIGNFTVSLLAAFSVYVVYLIFKSQDYKLIIFYAGFAALVTYIREIVKDMEDIDGESSAGYKTFPVLAGLGQSKTIAMITIVFVLVSYGNLLLQWTMNQFKMPILGVVLVYHVLCVVVPMIILLYLTYKSRVKSDFTRLSAIVKYIMATGLMSMVFY
jgi:4-hydroxybenzoate polyprenyltransferase